MPKIVDPEARREEVADATFRVIDRAGLEGASLRAIADEAKLAIGSVRHYFDSHSELTIFALATLRDRLTARILAHIGRFEQLGRADKAKAVRQAAEELFAEMLPLDEQRRQEAAVWLAFIAAARVNPELQTHAHELHDGMRMLVGRVLQRLQQSGRLPAGRELDTETERLCSLIDGLTLNGLIRPQRLSRARMRALLAEHLDTLLL